jgi:hypothetical protein
MAIIIHGNTGRTFLEVKPATGPRGGDPERMDAFLEKYTHHLYKAHDKEPDEYAYSRDEVPIVAEKMTRSLASGSANLSDSAKKAAKDLGVHPTMGAISAWLNGREAPPVRRRGGK